MVLSLSVHLPAVMAAVISPAPAGDMARALRDLLGPLSSNEPSWGRLSFATGSTLEKVDRNVRVMTAGPLLSAVQRSTLFDDCKTFVDMPMRFDPEVVRHHFESLPSEPSEEELRRFVYAQAVA